MEIHNPNSNSTKSQSWLTKGVVVASLGYFVDLYDLVLFGVVRDPSLRAIGVADADLLHVGESLLSLQMLGMLVGGIIWGILGDKLGRLKVLFGSILMYSIANILNAWVQTVSQYEILRFIAGVGLAGELGAGVTLIAESLPTKKRGLGTMVMVVFGALGAVAAALVAGRTHWQTAYYVGGGLGLGLLLLRASTHESQMFKDLANSDKASRKNRGNLWKILSNWSTLRPYLMSIIIGIPVWYVIGILIFNGPEFAKQLQIDGIVVRGQCIMFAYLGLSAGDLASGLLSQWLRSRKKTVYIFLLGSASIVAYFLYVPVGSPSQFYWLCFLLGFFTGYWAIFVTMAAEQFGVNNRATVATTVPNWVRGAVYPLVAAFAWLRDDIAFGLVSSAAILGIICFVIAALATFSVKETFHKDLNYID